MLFKLFGRDVYIRKSLVVSAAVVLLAVSIIIGYEINNRGADIIIESEGGFAEESEKTGLPGSDLKEPTRAQETAVKGTEARTESTVAELPAENEEIKVYVVGCVKKEGIVTLKKGQLIDDAIKAAGGATQDADIKNINLVYELTENVMLRIKSVKESQAETQSKTNTNTGAQGKSGVKPAENEAKAGKGIEIIKDSGGAVVNSGIESEEKSVGKININTASIEELDTLSGIGEATAQKIIDYRQKNGRFKKISDIMQVSGIGTSKFDKIKDFITVD